MNTKLDILKKIKSGEVEMKPHWHFVLKSLLLLLGVIVTSLLVVYILSFILFFLRQSGIGFVPLYGFRGVIIFVMNSPWLLIASVGALVVVLQLLVKKYSFSFRQPLLYSLIGIVFLVLLSSYVLERTQFHHRLQGFATERGLPVFDSLYRGIDEKRPENIIFGSITEIKDDGFMLETDTDESLKVFISKETRQRPNTMYGISDTVLVFGDRTGASSVAALGVRPAPADFSRESFSNKRPRSAGSDNERPPRPPAESPIQN